MGELLGPKILDPKILGQNIASQYLQEAAEFNDGLLAVDPCTQWQPDFFNSFNTFERGRAGVRNEIRPVADKVTFVLPEQARDLEFGFGCEKPDYILCVNTSNVANGGPVTQMLQVSNGLRDFSDVPIGYVGPPLDPESFVDDMVGFLPKRIYDIEPSITHADRYRNVSVGLTRVMRNLAEQGNRNIFVVTTGYTGFVPFGVKEAMRHVREEGHDDIRVKVLVQDSSFPDTDTPSCDVDSGGFPIDRFCPDAYGSDPEGVDVFFALNNWLPIDPEDDGDRAPKGTVCMSATFPFRPQLVKELFDMRRNYTRQGARDSTIEALPIIKDREDQKVYPALKKMLSDPDNIFMQFVASGGYFDKDNIGKWMTEEQYIDMWTGSENLLRSLSSLSYGEKNSKPIILTGHERFVEIARDLVNAGDFPDNVQIVSREADLGNEKLKPGVYVTEVPFLSYGQYKVFMKAAHITIHRTSQQNAMAEAIHMGVPCMVLTMPDHGYMSSATMDRLFEGAQYGVGADFLEVAETMRNILDDVGRTEERFRGKDYDKSKRSRTVKNQDKICMRVYRDKGRNFWSLVAHIAGLQKIK